MVDEVKAYDAEFGSDETRFRLATGNVGVPGGSSGGRVWGGLPLPRCGYLPVPTVPSGPSVPVYQWPDAVLDGKEGLMNPSIRIDPEHRSQVVIVEGKLAASVFQNLHLGLATGTK